MGVIETKIRTLSGALVHDMCMFQYKKRSKKRRAHLRIEGEKSNWQAMDTGRLDTTEACVNS